MKRPVIDLRPEDVRWERDVSATPPVLHVAFEYVRELELPGLGRTIEKPLAVDLELEISRVEWGPTR